jgi:hypothetical protein
MKEFGQYSQGVYPTMESVFDTQGTQNYGSYSDPQADNLITASVSDNRQDAVKQEAAYLTEQQPALFQPLPDTIVAWKKTLSGPADSFANLTQYYFTPERWYFTG